MRLCQGRHERTYVSQQLAKTLALRKVVKRWSLMAMIGFGTMRFE